MNLDPIKDAFVDGISPRSVLMAAANVGFLAIGLAANLTVGKYVEKEMIANE